MSIDPSLSKLEKSEQLIAQMITRFAENGIHTEVVSTATFFDEVDQENITSFYEAIRWLLSEGLIRTGEILAMPLSGPIDVEVRVVLTADGFALLGKKLGNGELVGTAVRKAGSGAGYANAGELIGGILGAFTKSVSG